MNRGSKLPAVETWDWHFREAPGHRWLPTMRFLLAPLLFVLGPVRGFGQDRIPKEGGLIVLANHLADFDPIVVQITSPRPIYFMSKSELFDMKVVGWFLKWMGGFPVRRGEPDRKALRYSAELAKNGEAMGIFPEGQLSENGQLQPLKPGVGLIIRLAGVPVVCCGLKNTERVVPYGSLVPRPAFRTVSAHWGQPKQFPPDASNDEIMSWVEQELRRLIADPSL